ncbi:hypothetical protein Tco_0293941 [Tanacetum coccineum]
MTTRMTVRAQPVMSPGHSARVIEAMALLDSAFRKRYGSSYETPSPSPTLLVRKRYRGTPEPILNTDSLVGRDKKRSEPKEDRGRSRVPDVEMREEEAVPEGQQRALAAEEDQVHSTFEVGYGSGSVPEPKRPELYIDIPAYPPPAPLVQTPPSLEWSSGSLPISPTHSTVPSPISSSMISLTVPSPIASPVATPTATISRIDRDVRRPVLALEAWARHVDTRMEDMPRARCDDHRLIHDMLVQQAALQRELQEMRGRVTTLEQERDRRER